MDQQAFSLWRSCGHVLANTSATQESFRFQVYYDQKPIGTHDFTVSHRDGKTRVRSRARFNYRFLMISLYEYSHDADEVWEGDCLIGLTATTTTNGLDQSVNLDKDELQARAERLL